MKAREYLSQAYRLDQRIASDIEEVSRLRAMSSSISSPSWECSVPIPQDRFPYPQRSTSPSLLPGFHPV